MHTVKSIKEIFREELKERVDQLSPRYLLSVRPIYGSTSSGRPDHIGSAVLFKVDSHHFLITAAHVIDWKKEATLYVGGEKEFIELRGDCYSTVHESGDREKDKYDFAILKLNFNIVSKFGDIRFITPNQTNPNDFIKRGRVYLALGYPNTKNRKFDNNLKKTTSNPLIYSSVITDNQNLYYELGVQQYTHALLKFDKKRVKDESGQIVISPNPTGASGGGLFYIGDFADPDTYAPGPVEGKLVGILIEWHSSKKVIMAVRVSTIIETIRLKYPELSYSLPRAKNVNITLNL